MVAGVPFVYRETQRHRNTWPATACHTIHDEVESAHVIRPNSRRGGVSQPLLRYDSPFRPQHLSRDSDARSFYGRCSPRQQARATAGNRMVAKTIDCSAAPRVQAAGAPLQRQRLAPRSLNDDGSMMTVLLFDTSADLRFCMTDLPVDEFVMTPWLLLFSTSRAETHVDCTASC